MSYLYGGHASYNHSQTPPNNTPKRPNNTRQKYFQKLNALLGQSTNMLNETRITPKRPRYTPNKLTKTPMRSTNTPRITPKRPRYTPHIRGVRPTKPIKKRTYSKSQEEKRYWLKGGREINENKHITSTTPRYPKSAVLKGRGAKVFSKKE